LAVLAQAFQLSTLAGIPAPEKIVALLLGNQVKKVAGPWCLPIGVAKNLSERGIGV